MRNLILGLISNYKYELLKPFILSFEKANIPHTDIIFFTDNNEQEDINKILQHKNIHIMKFTNPENMRLTVIRHFLYLNFLLKNKGISNVMIADTRDVIFQEDPFKHTTENSMHFFLEDDRMTLGKCPINSEWMYKVFGWEEYRRVRDYKISCAGVSIGDYKSMVNYLTMMTYFMKKTGKCHDDIDQPIHNFLSYDGFIKDYLMFSNEEGYIATVGHSLPNSFKFDNEGYLLNKHDVRYSIIHQYDRHFDEFKNKWVLFK